MKLCVVIPVYKDSLESYEVMSAYRINTIFKNVPKYLFYPNNISPNTYLEIIEGLRLVPLDHRYFSSIDSYNRLLKSPVFYGPVGEYDFMLLYQLDSYIFDESKIYDFIDCNFDYIGAPWLKLNWYRNSTKLVTKFRSLEPFIRKVGNGGFSLRKVKTFYKYSKYLSVFNLLVSIQEDIFWTNIASRFIPGFKLPTISDALKFGFDEDPQDCFKLNNNELPFGCHGWQKNDPEFWKSYINTKK